MRIPESIRLPNSITGRVVAAVIAVAVVAGVAAIPARSNVTRVLGPAEAAALVPDQPVTGQPKNAVGAKTLPVPAALFKAGLDLRAPEVAVPLRLRIPKIGLDAPVFGVGVTPKNVMDAPMGPPDDPSWHQAFWYRGSAVPGAASTALIAGHIDGGGRPATFAHLSELRKGDRIMVRDTRTDLDMTFVVTGAVAYSLAQTTKPAVLKWMYGVGPVEGTKPQPSADGLAHLTLVTCSGTFVGGTHDHRLTVFATRIG
jgi:Sortase domain